MANFAALGRTHAAGFAGRVRREVVLVHVTLRRDGRKVIQLLLHAEHGQGRHTQNLGLTTLEESRTVDARKNLDLGAQRADGTQRTAIHTDFFAQGAVTNGLLLQRTECSLEFLFTLGELLGQRFEHIGLDLVDCLFAGELAFSEKSLGELIANPLLNRCVLLVGVIQEDREFSGFLGGNLCNLHLSFTQCANEGLCGLEAISHDIFGRRNSACLDEIPFVFAAASFDHHDRNVFATIFSGNDTAGDNDIEDGTLHLRPARECDPLAVDEGQTGTCDGAREGKTSNLGRHRGSINCQDVICLVGVCSQNGCDNLNLVAQALLEAGAQRTVDQTRCQDCFGSGTAFAAEERSGDTAGRVGTFFNVNGQREKVKLILGLLAHGGRGQNRGFIIEVGHGRTCGLLGEAARFKTHDALTETAIVDDRLC